MKTVTYFQEQQFKLDRELREAIESYLKVKIEENGATERSRLKIDFWVDNKTLKRNYIAIGLNWNDEAVLIYKSKRIDDSAEYVANVFALSIDEKISLYRHLINLYY